MLKIGILIRDFKTLQNWELRIVESIKNNPTLELDLLITDGRVDKKDKTAKIVFSEFLFKKQVSFERNRYLKNLQTVNKAEIFEYLNTIPALEVMPTRDGDLDIFNNDDCQLIKEYDLDIILKHGFNTINGKILDIAKYGIWFMIHGNSSINIGPSGFWEILTKQPIVEVSLVQLTLKNNKGLIIDKAYFNRHIISFVTTNIKTLESSVSLLFKNINKIELGCIAVSNSVPIYSSFDSSPKLGNTLKYSYNYFKGLSKAFFHKIFGSFGKRVNHWTFIIGKGNFMDSDLLKLRPLKVPNDEFWADPFLFKYKDEHFAFFENYSYNTGLGKISCGKVQGTQLINIKDVLDFDYHLSYPFVFEEEGEVFMMPETGGNNRLEIYKCINFPNKWELFTTAFNGEKIADAFFFNDSQKQKWLFLNKVLGQNADNTSELYIYKVDSIKLNKLEPHHQNPVIIDSRIARNGGAIFEYNGMVFRPSQSNTDGVYGKALNINQIKKLTIDKYIEKTIKKVEPNFQEDMVMIHHLHQVDGLFVFDTAFKEV